MHERGMVETIPSESCGYTARIRKDPLDVNTLQSRSLKGFGEISG